MMLMRICVSPLCFFAQSVKAEERKRIHVLEFEGALGSSELQSLTDRSRSGARDVLPQERENIRLILETDSEEEAQQYC